MDSGRMTVAGLSRRTGVPGDSIRYYERVGLLPEPERSPAGYRRYDESAVDRLGFIQGARRLGLRLREIGDLLSIRDTGTCSGGDAAVLLRDRMREIDDEVVRLEAFKAELSVMVGHLPGADRPDPEPGGWRPPVRTAS